MKIIYQIVLLLTLVLTGCTNLYLRSPTNKMIETRKEGIELILKVDAPKAEIEEGLKKFGSLDEKKIEGVWTRYRLTVFRRASHQEWLEINIKFDENDLLVEYEEIEAWSINGFVG